MKEFKSKKEALAHLKTDALACVGWGGENGQCAINWNGKTQIQGKTVKKLWK